MAMLLLKSDWPKFSYFLKKWHFLVQIIIMSDFLVQIRNQSPLTHAQNFQPNWTKDKGSRILTSNDTRNCLMASYTCLYSTSPNRVNYFWGKDPDATLHEHRSGAVK